VLSGSPSALGRKRTSFDNGCPASGNWSLDAAASARGVAGTQPDYLFDAESCHGAAISYAIPVATVNRRPSADTYSCSAIAHRTFSVRRSSTRVKTRWDWALHGTYTPATANAANPIAIAAGA